MSRLLPIPERAVRLFSRIWIRLLLFNVLLVFLPAFGILSLETYEQELLDYQERSMVQQARVLAAALGGEPSLDAARAQAILERMNQQVDARLRVVGKDFGLLADSSRLGPVAETGQPEPPAPEEEIRDSLVYRVGNFFYQLYARFVLPPEPPVRDAGFYATAKKLVGPEIEDALRGGYGSTTRRTAGQRSLTLYSALPVRNDRGEVVGAVLVSKSTFQILGSLYELRLSTFQVVLMSVTAAVVLSLLLSTTIARPVAQLQKESHAILDRRGRLRGRFQAYERRDEIGDLSRALAELTRRLHEHLRFTESFASDVSHEFKNPLASIRSATELLESEDDPVERQRFVTMIQREVARLERLLSAVREVAVIDASIDDEPLEAVDLRRLLAGLAESARLRARSARASADGSESAVEHRLAVPDDPVVVRVSPDRLAQVLENLIDNATSFAPPGTAVDLELARDGDEAVVSVADCGPGIPAEHLEKIFDRFFSYRPDHPKSGHTGLGLAIARAIAEAHRGSLHAENRDDGGARFVLRLPIQD